MLTAKSILYILYTLYVKLYLLDQGNQRGTKGKKSKKIPSQGEQLFLSFTMSKSCSCILTINFAFLFESLFLFYHYQKSAYMVFITFLYILLLLQCHRGIELNPVSKELKKNLLSVCHWNLNSLPAHNFSKLTEFLWFNGCYSYKHSYFFFKFKWQCYFALF